MPPVFKGPFIKYSNTEGARREDPSNLLVRHITLLCGRQGQNGPTVTKVKSSEVPAETRAERIMEDNPADVGTIPDSIDVNKSGEANYVIPIVSPP